MFHWATDMVKKIMSTLVGFLKFRREEMGLSQSEVAERLGYSTAQYISNIEREAAGTKISHKQLVKFSKVYSVDSELLVKLYMTDFEDRVRKELGL